MSLLEILQNIPDKRRKQGQKYDLAHLLFYSILSILCGANSYAGIHTVLKAKLKLLNKVSSELNGKKLQQLQQFSMSLIP